MPFHRIADRKIREAMEEGQFDGLSNQGRPLDLDGYFKLPTELRMAYSVLKSAGCVPEEVALLNEVSDLEGRLAAAGDDRERSRIHKELEAARLRLSLALERARRR